MGLVYFSFRQIIFIINVKSLYVSNNIYDPDNSVKAQDF